MVAPIPTLGWFRLSDGLWVRQFSSVRSEPRCPSARADACDAGPGETPLRAFGTIRYGGHIPVAQTSATQKLSPVPPQVSERPVPLPQ